MIGLSMLMPTISGTEGVVYHRSYARRRATYPSTMGSYIPIQAIVQNANAHTHTHRYIRMYIYIYIYAHVRVELFPIIDLEIGGTKMDKASF